MDVAVANEPSSEWQRQYDESLRTEAERIEHEAVPGTGREVLLVVLALAIPMGIVGVFVGPAGGWHPTVWQRIGNATGLAFASAMLALRLWHPTDD